MVVKKIVYSLFIVTSLLSLVACGNNGKSKSKNKNKDPITERVTEEAQEEGDQGIYRAVLSPLNENLAGKTSGTVEIKIEGDDFIVESNLINSPSGVKHLQSIMTGDSCPKGGADANRDGVIDVNEGSQNYGQVFIPLDSNLSEQIAGINFGPIANTSGSYVYRRSTTLSMLLSDLYAPDPDMTDNIVKLPTGENLRLNGKVIIVHGVSSNLSFAASVSTIRDLTTAQSIPIACGKLVRVASEDTN